MIRYYTWYAWRQDEGEVDHRTKEIAADKWHDEGKRYAELKRESQDNRKWSLLEAAEDQTERL